MKKYTNAQKFNDGISVLGQVPIDDRLVFTSWDDIYISAAKQSDSALYSKAYTGMVVAIVEDEETATLAILRDDTPYTPGKTIDVSEGNYLTYWSIEGKDISDYIYNSLVPTIDASVKRLDASVSLSENRIVDISIYVDDLNTNFNSFVQVTDTSTHILDDSVNLINDELDTLNNKTIRNINTHLRTLDVSSNDTDERLDITNENLDALKVNVETYKITVNGYVDVLNDHIYETSTYALDVSNNLNTYKNDNNSSISNIHNIINTLDASITDTCTTLDSSIKALTSEFEDDEAVQSTVMIMFNKNINAVKKDIDIIKAFLKEMYPDETTGFQHFYDNYDA